jgi:hypothetical protein
MISSAMKLACVERELRMRRRVYSHLVARGQMSEAEADREIATMVAIAADYRQAVAHEQLELFSTGGSVNDVTRQHGPHGLQGGRKT